MEEKKLYALNYMIRVVETEQDNRWERIYGRGIKYIAGKDGKDVEEHFENTIKMEILRENRELLSVFEDFSIEIDSYKEVRIREYKIKLEEIIS